MYQYPQVSAAFGISPTTTNSYNSYYKNPTQSSYSSNAPTTSSDNIYTYNQNSAPSQNSEYYLPPQWANKQNYSWSNYFCGQPSSYNHSPGNASLTSNDFSNKSFDNSSLDFNSNQNGSFNYSYSSVQSSPSSYTCNQLYSLPSNMPSHNSSPMTSVYNQYLQPVLSTNNSINLQDTERKMSPKSAKTPKPMLKRHAQLSDHAVEIMNEWFQSHISNPYPSLAEKETIAQQCRITVKQVTAWFSNRRNRSQNTKPKRMKRVLEKEINNIFNELICSQPDKEKIIEKINISLGNHSC